MRFGIPTFVSNLFNLNREERMTEPSESTAEGLVEEQLVEMEHEEVVIQDMAEVVEVQALPSSSLISKNFGFEPDMESSNDFDYNGEGTTDEGDDEDTDEEFDKENDEYKPDDSDEPEEEDESFMEITRRRLSSQDREGNCYCGKDRNLNIAELLCASCNRWYHESCIGYQLGKVVPFTMNYVFICKNCSASGLESYKRNQAQFGQMCLTALANLTQASIKDGKNQKLFSKERDIIPWFEMHWEGMTTITRRVTSSWHSTVTKTLHKDVGTNYIIEEIPNDPNSPYFQLKDLDLNSIKPNYEAMHKSGQLKLTEGSGNLLRRGTKRRTTGEAINFSQGSLATKKARGDSFLPTKILGHGYPTEHPFNKDGYRYILAEPDSSAPFRQEFDECSDWAGKIIPGWLYRVSIPSFVLLALHDRAPQLRVSDDRLSVTGEKGYSMIRATHGVTNGCYYWEGKIVDLPEGGAIRIGFSQPNGNLQTPLGFDRYGYSWRSVLGTKFHQAKGKSYTGKVGFGLGDVLGCLIYLPKIKGKSYLPASFKDKPLVRFKSHLYYEDKDGENESPTEKEEKERICEGSKIIFFKNGVCQGVAFENIFEGTYFPAVSLYRSTTVRLNFGPDFEAPPKDSPIEWRGFHERAQESIMEQTMSDLSFLTEHHGKLNLENLSISNV